ncbi:MAG: HlyD family efflux transporter periplasmic adaptor subunit [Prolixibacteraceae bacterium]|nr:HlyD family efflux transporter periplasmic adaptor subunit [Prolixibacteraceae bacterium]
MNHAKAVNNYNMALKKEKLIHDQYHKQWNASLAQYQTENNDMKATIARMEKQRDQYFIVAPVDGTVIQYSGIKEGNFIVPNQLLAEISPDAGLLVECYVSPSDIGFFKKGMKVNYQLDAFNYNQWGMSYGSINEISGDIVTVNEQAVFKVRCSLDKKYLQLKNGYRGELKKGMTLTGRFSLTERTLWQLLFDKVDNWLNPKLADI